MVVDLDILTPSETKDYIYQISIHYYKITTVKKSYSQMVKRSGSKGQSVVLDLHILKPSETKDYTYQISIKYYKIT